MKIQWDGKATPTPPNTGPAAPASGGEAAQFAETLKTAMGPDAPPQTPSSAPLAPLGGVRPPMEIVPARISPLSTAPLVTTAETVLNQLEGLAGRLGDPKVNFSALAPLVQELAEQKKALSAALGSLPDGHPLRGIVGDVLDTVFTTLGRFYRGDFGS